MSDLGTIISFTPEEKELYSNLKFKYFLDQNIKTENLSAEKIQLIHKGYTRTIEKIKTDRKENKYQYHLFIEGYVRKMHAGGMLGCHFNLSKAVSFSITRFEDYGENWAYFEAWAKKEKTIIRRKKVWKRIVEFGALLGFILTAIHLYEMFILNKK